MTKVAPGEWHQNYLHDHITELENWLLVLWFTHKNNLNKIIANWDLLKLTLTVNLFEFEIFQTNNTSPKPSLPILCIFYWNIFLAPAWKLDYVRFESGLNKIIMYII